jgi:hypothetical protein
MSTIPRGYVIGADMDGSDNEVAIAPAEHLSPALMVRVCSQCWRMLIVAPASSRHGLEYRLASVG